MQTDLPIKQKCKIEGHESEDVLAVCVKYNCQFKTRFLCLNCLISDHSVHAKFSIKLKDLKNQMHDLINLWPIDNDLGQKIQQQIKDNYKNNEINQQLQSQFISQKFAQFLLDYELELQKCCKECTIISDKEIADHDKATFQLQGLYMKYLNYEDINSLMKDYFQQKIDEQQFTLQLNIIIEKQNKVDQIKQIQQEYNILNKQLKKPIFDANLLDNIYQQSVNLLKNQTKMLLKKKFTPYFEASKAYSSSQWVAINYYSEQQEEAVEESKQQQYIKQLQEIVFSPSDSQTVVYSLDQIPSYKIEMTFTITSNYKSHLCVGLRKENELDTETYNKQPYVCLHCQATSEQKLQVVPNLTKIGNQFQIILDASKNDFQIFDLTNNRKIVKFQSQLNDSDYRLYLWTNKHTEVISLKMSNYQICF